MIILCIISLLVNLVHKVVFPRLIFGIKISSIFETTDFYFICFPKHYGLKKQKISFDTFTTTPTPTPLKAVVLNLFWPAPPFLAYKTYRRHPVYNLLVSRPQVRKLASPLEFFRASKGATATWLRTTALECHVLIKYKQNIVVCDEGLLSNNINLLSSSWISSFELRTTKTYFDFFPTESAFLLYIEVISFWCWKKVAFFEMNSTSSFNYSR